MKLKKRVFGVGFTLFLGIVSILYIPFLNRATYHGLINITLDESIPYIYSKEMMVNKKVIILDTRTFEEYSQSHIPNAIWIGENSSEIPKLEKNDSIVLYCSIGKRSELEGEKLKMKGYENVLNLYGGIFEWHNNGYVTVNSKNDTIVTIHPYSWFWGLWVR